MWPVAWQGRCILATTSRGEGIWFMAGQGKVCFGDNIEDEWFIVWLLQEATRKVTGATARVWDNDGEFVLIEVSHHIPSWLRPDTSANRVWLHEGLLHIIPRPSKRYPSLPALPSLSEGLKIVRSDAVETSASSKIQQALAGRTARYPGQAQKNMIRWVGLPKRT